MAAKVCMKWDGACVQGEEAGWGAWACAVGSVSVLRSYGGELVMARGWQSHWCQGALSAPSSGPHGLPSRQRPGVSARGRSEWGHCGLRGRGNRHREQPVCREPTNRGSDRP